MNNLETAVWVGSISILLIIFCFYFTLTFIEKLHEGDTRITKQSKLAAIICLGLALFIPFLYSLIF
ncbi:hypothetical protein ACFSTA_01700 [Ornithinibacillus salinisoli]|uniref:Uncharacterized protein n=1 Tax=Ornithinibacillus salinisoli TaxID=1848459 RepID=A0ABW4VWE3_9BACI